MRSTKTILKWVILLLLFALSVVFTFGDKIDNRIPTWDDIYQFFGLAEEPEKGEVYEKPLTVSFLDVGQGSATLIRCEDPDFTMLVDTGEQGNDEVIRAEMKRLHMDRLDYVVLTHPHSDHVGSFPELVKEKVAIKNVMLPLLDPNNLGENEALYRVMMNSIQSSGAKTVTATPGMRLVFDSDEGESSVTLEVLGPVGGIEQQIDNLNNRSVFLKVTYGDVSFLFTGDGESDEENEVVEWLNSEEGKASGITGQTTVLAVGHHGSHTSSTRRFLAVVQPKYGIISCGKDNDYGHPHDSTLENLKDAGARIYRTDEIGTIVFGTDGSALFN